MCLQQDPSNSSSNPSSWLVGGRGGVGVEASLDIGSLANWPNPSISGSEEEHNVSASGSISFNFHHEPFQWVQLEPHSTDEETGSERTMT